MVAMVAMVQKMMKGYVVKKAPGDLTMPSPNG